MSRPKWGDREDFFHALNGYGALIKEIWDRLDGAIAIIALQKNGNMPAGLGGARGLEKPRLYLTMSCQNVLTILKAKNWRYEENPNGLQLHYKLVQGCHFHPIKDWHKGKIA